MHLLCRLQGGKAIGVPGEIKSFYEAWKTFGRVPWHVLFEEAIRLSEEGFRVERALEDAMRSYESVLKNDKNLRSVCYRNTTC